MQRCEDNVAARLNGNALQPLSEVSVTVTDDKTGLPATLYSDNGVTQLFQPLKTDDNGYYGFYAANGEYTLTFSGIRIATFNRKIVLQDPDDNPYATKAELAAGSGASLVAFTQAGTGAVPLGVQDALRAGGIYAKQFGAQANVTTDQSSKLQAAWDAAAAAGVPFVVDGVYWVGLNDRTYSDGLVRKVGLQVPSNSRCIFAPGAALKTLPNNFTVGYTINSYLSDNFELWNPVVYGERAAHTGSTGESVHCFNIVNSVNAYIHRPVAYDAWGDGMYIGIEFFAATNKQAQNITVSEPKVSNARRNGISVTSGSNIKLIRPSVENVAGTFPQAGIDIEPEGQGNTLPICDNWLIESPVTRNCAGAGINIYTNGMVANSTVDISIVSHRDYGSYVGMVGQHGGVAVTGKVEVVNPVWKESQTNGCRLKTTTSGPLMAIVGALVENCGATQTVLSGNLDSAFCVLRETGESSTPIMGNFLVTAARVRDTRATKKTSGAFYSNDQPTGNTGAFSNAVIDLVEDSSASPWRFTFYKVPDSTVRITTADGSIMSADITLGNSYVRKAIVPATNAAYRNIYLSAVRQPISAVNLCTSQPLSIYPQTGARIFPIATASNKAIYSFDPGASVNLYPSGANDWVAEIVSGTWTSA